MTIIVEDGSIVSGANSYVTTSELTTFATARNITLTSGAETLLIQAMDYIESLSYKGLKRNRTQALQWPRVDVYFDGWWFDTNSIPQQLKDGLCHAAIAVDQGTNLDADAIRKTMRERVGDVEVEYDSSSISAPYNIKIMNSLYKLLDSASLKVSKA